MDCRPSYEDVAARFWNLIYKDNYHGGKKPRTESPSKAQSLTVANVDKEFADALTDQFRFDFGSLQNLLGSKASLEKYSMNQASFLPFAGGAHLPPGPVRPSQNPRAFARSTMRSGHARAQSDANQGAVPCRSSVFARRKLSNAHNSNHSPPVGSTQFSPQGAYPAAMEHSSARVKGKLQALQQHQGLPLSLISFEDHAGGRQARNTLHLEPVAARNPDLYNPQHFSMEMPGGPGQRLEEQARKQTLAMLNLSRLSDNKNKDVGKRMFQTVRHSEQANMHKTLGAFTPLNEQSGAITAQHLHELHYAEAQRSQRQSPPTTLPSGKKASKVGVAARKPHQQSPTQRYQKIDRTRNMTPIIVPNNQTSKTMKEKGQGRDSKRDDQAWAGTPASGSQLRGIDPRSLQGTTPTQATAVTPGGKPSSLATPIMKGKKGRMMPQINQSSGQDL